MDAAAAAGRIVVDPFDHRAARIFACLGIPEGHAELVAVVAPPHHARAHIAARHAGAAHGRTGGQVDEAASQLRIDLVAPTSSGTSAGVK